MVLPKHKNPYIGVIKFTILVDPYFVIINLYLVCLIYVWEYRNFFLEIIHFHYIWFIWPRPTTRTSTPWVMKLTFFCRLFLGHYNYKYSLVEPCAGVEKKSFRELHQFDFFLLQKYLLLAWRIWNLYCFVSLLYRYYILNLVKIGPVGLEIKMLTHSARKWTPTHSNRSMT